MIRKMDGKDEDLESMIRKRDDKDEDMEENRNRK